MLTTEQEIRTALDVREKIGLILDEEASDPKDLDEPTLRTVKRLMRDANRLLVALYARDQRQRRGG